MPVCVHASMHKEIKTNLYRGLFHLLTPPLLHDVQVTALLLVHFPFRLPQATVTTWVPPGFPWKAQSVQRCQADPLCSPGSLLQPSSHLPEGLCWAELHIPKHSLEKCSLQSQACLAPMQLWQLGCGEQWQESSCLPSSVNSLKYLRY